jgi:hypothetical protein
VYPLDAVYGPFCYNAFQEHGSLKGESLKSTLQRSSDIYEYEPLTARSYAELIETVSFFSVMNKRHSLFFRGQARHLPLRPTIFRSNWRSLSGVVHDIPNSPAGLQRVYDHLHSEIAPIVLLVCSAFPMPRRATLSMFREAIWAVAQHYELWPTPLIDITPNLRAAASFALWNGRTDGELYVVALPPSTNSITFEADQHVVLARLQAVCPPAAKRPHYQDGFLVGRFPFIGPNPNEIDSRPDQASDLSRRLVARIRLKDEGSFWNVDFPRMSPLSLLPQANDDRLLEQFQQHIRRLDDAMQEICLG